MKALPNFLLVALDEDGNQHFIPCEHPLNVHRMFATFPAKTTVLIRLRDGRVYRTLAEFDKEDHSTYKRRSFHILYWKSCMPGFNLSTLEHLRSWWEKWRNRRSGQTTRLVDEYVQTLFNNPGRAIYIEDHEKNDSSNTRLAHRIRERLEIEHSIECEMKKVKGGTFLELPRP